MSLFIQNNYGTINHFENAVVTISNDRTAVQPVAATQDVQPVQKETSFFSRITQEAYEKGKAKAVEEELRRACISAPKLIAAIRTNEALGYLDSQNLSSKELYDLLNEHYALPFTCHNFTVYRSKNH